MARPSGQHLGAAIVLGLVALTGCRSDASDGSAASTPAADAAASTVVTGATTSTRPTESSPAGAVTAGPARTRVDWLVELLNRTTADPAVVEDGFTAEFLAQVPLERLVAAVGSLVGSDTGWVVADDAELERYGGEATLASEQERKITVTINVERDPPHRIAGLAFAPVIPEVFAAGETVTSEAIAAKLEDLGAAAAFGVFEMVDGDCRLVAGLTPETVMPIGSAFKLWILGALALEIEAGRASWDEELAVSGALKSSSDGEVSPLPDGAPVTLRQFAEWMISISDNSATDHLLHRLGRETVEAAMTASGIADPVPNVPMLSTRELFLLKYGTVVPTAEYLALDAGGRRAVLDDRLAGISLGDELGSSTRPAAPTAIREFEWFASPLDLCRTHAWLAELADRPGLGPVAEILKLNPGIPFEAPWVDVRFKGGSELGVVFAAWRLERDDGRVFAVAGGVADPTKGIDELRSVLVLAAAAQLAPTG